MGFLRFALAVSVILSHAGPVFGIVGMNGYRAVQVFFIISGFLITFVLNEKYAAPGMLGAFYIGRVLRIFPLYYLSLAAMLAVSAITGALAWNLRTFASFEGAYAAWFGFSHIFLIGQDLAYVLCLPSSLQPGLCFYPNAFLFNLLAWTLSDELMFYLVAPLIVRSPRRLLVYFAVGAVYLLAVQQVTFPLHGFWPFKTVLLHEDLNYFPFPATFFFFAAGGLAYHFVYRTLRPNAAGPVRLGRWTYPTLLAVVATAACINLTPLSGLDALLFAGVVPLLFILTGNNGFDNFLGQLSYPIYILQLPMLDLSRYVFAQPSLTAALPWLTLPGLSLALCLAAGLLGTLAVERPTDRLRHAIARRIAGNRQSDRPARTRTPPVLAGFLLAYAGAAAVAIFLLLRGTEALPVTTAQVADRADPYWTKGVSDVTTLISVPANPVNAATFIVGRMVQLADGSLRQIVMARPGIPDYLELLVSGAPLDSNLVGFPHSISPNP